jgi:hypothetical protein
MPKPRKFKDSDADKLREDTAETAYRVLQEAIGERPKTQPPGERTEAEKESTAVKRGRKGGRKGGRVRAKNLTPARRKESARKAATTRWKKPG